MDVKISHPTKTQLQASVLQFGPAIEKDASPRPGLKLRRHAWTLSQVTLQRPDLRDVPKTAKAGYPHMQSVPPSVRYCLKCFAVEHAAPRHSDPDSPSTRPSCCSMHALPPLLTIPLLRAGPAGHVRIHHFRHRSIPCFLPRPFFEDFLVFDSCRVLFSLQELFSFHTSHERVVVRAKLLSKE